MMTQVSRTEMKEAQGGTLRKAPDPAFRSRTKVQTKLATE